MARATRASLSLAAAQSTGRRVCENNDLLLSILGHLDDFDIRNVLTVNRAFLWAAHDVISRYEEYTLDEVHYLNAENIGDQAALDAVRSLQTHKPIQSEVRSRPLASQFSPSNLKALQRKCPKLRKIRCDEVDAKSPIRSWEMDIRDRTICVSEVKSVLATADLDGDYLDRNIGAAWEGYAVTRKVKVSLNFVGPGSALFQSADEWILRLANSSCVQAIAVGDLFADDTSSARTMIVDVVVQILNARKAHGNHLKRSP